MKQVLVVALAGLALAACGGTAAAKPAVPVSRGTSYTINIVSSTAGPILAEAGGRTLYYFKLDSGGRSACAGSCTVDWRPLLVSQRPTASPELNGELATAARPDGGSQVLFNDWPLYTFAGDKKPGDTNGQGVAGAWFVATPSLSDADAALEQPTPTPNVPAPTAVPAAPTAVPAAPPPAPTPTPRTAPAPSFNDHDGDNNGGPNDGDGNG